MITVRMSLRFLGLFDSNIRTRMLDRLLDFPIDVPQFKSDIREETYHDT